MKPYITNLQTFADLLDRLAIEVNKISFFENKKREEHAKESPDLAVIAHWDNLSRDGNEYRSRFKNEINSMLTEIKRTGSYETMKELRTFRGPPRSVGEILAERCYEISNNAELIMALVAQLEDDD